MHALVYSRTYHYVLLNSIVRSPTLVAERDGFRPLDIDRCVKVQAFLLASMTLQAFAQRDVRQNLQSRPCMVDIRQSGEVFVFTLRASAFCITWFGILSVRYCVCGLWAGSQVDR